MALTSPKAVPSMGLGAAGCCGANAWNTQGSLCGHMPVQQTKPFG